MALCCHKVIELITFLLGFCSYCCAYRLLFRKTRNQAFCDYIFKVQLLFHWILLMANSPAKPSSSVIANQTFVNDTPAFICLSLILGISFITISLFAVMHYPWLPTSGLITLIFGLCHFIWKFERTPFSHGELSLTLNHHSHHSHHEEL